MFYIKNFFRRIYSLCQDYVLRTSIDRGENYLTLKKGKKLTILSQIIHMIQHLKPINTRRKCFSCIGTIVWLHHQDFNKHPEKKQNKMRTMQECCMLFLTNRKYPTKLHILYHLLAFLQAVEISRTRNMGQCWRSSHEVLWTTKYGHTVTLQKSNRRLYYQGFFQTAVVLYHKTNVLCCKERSPQKKKYSNSRLMEENIAVVYYSVTYDRCNSKSSF